VPYLLGLLQSASSPLSAANKAHVVQALKALRNSSNQQLAEKVAAMLERCPGWAEYRDQKHDLFLAGGQEHNYLTGTVLFNFYYFSCFNPD
jgi:DnaJ family protein C protein 13